MNRNKILLLLILLIALFFRFYNSQNRYGIGYDGSRDALVAFESARQLQLPLTGSFSSIGPITFGPLYYWYITLSTLLPTVWGPWVAINVASFLMVFIMYKTGKLLINESFGIILACVTALSPAQIISGTQLQQHALIGFLSSVVIYFFVKHYYQRFSTFEYILWGFCLGSAINSHYQAVSLLTLPLLAVIFFKRKKFIFTFILGLFISFIPFLIFELTNHWFNTRNILDYILIGQYRVWTSNRWIIFLGNFIPQFWSYVTGIPIFLSSIAFFSSVPIILYLYIKKVLSKPFFVILLSFLALLTSLRYYRGEKFF